MKIQLIYPLHSAWPFESFLLCGYYISCCSGPSVTHLLVSIWAHTMPCFLFSFFKKIYFLFLAVVSLHYGMRAFSSSREWGLLRSCGAVASLVVEHRL